MDMKILRAVAILLTCSGGLAAATPESGEVGQSLDGKWSFTVDPAKAEAGGTEG
jgi:hypothetical protein